MAYYDKTFDLDKLTSVDFIVVPFNETPSLGHTMLSFGFDDEDYLAVSVEIRRERGEEFSPIKGFFQQYELMYVVADERDVIQKRVNCDLSDVYLYRSTATPEQARTLFKDVMRRVNKLAREPEFYDTLTNNCTTNIRNHINHLKPDEVPYDYRVLLPGYSDRLAYDLGLIERHGSYEETRLRAKVNYQAYLHRDAPDFSRADPALAGGSPHRVVLSDEFSRPTGREAASTASTRHFRNCGRFFRNPARSGGVDFPWQEASMIVAVQCPLMFETRADFDGHCDGQSRTDSIVARVDLQARRSRRRRLALGD